ncbi:MAG TPA: SagB/ThcOx family dehydrogenase [Anaerolineae bacterium]|nr:SagB/ThcOx family dehydrogenase [Anaerolineae bacterium]
MTEELDRVFAYHQATKHHFGRFARGPVSLDWASQPEPFRRYRGARLIELERIAPGDQPPYDLAFFVGHLAREPLNRRSVSQLFFDSLALSAWKRAGDVSWSLRVNPSSGNLHPTEGYLVCGPVEGLTAGPVVAHYAPREHGLEVRADFSMAIWQALTADLPAGAILVGLSSVHWREAWKYGERAFRYCQHDVGHAIAAVSLAAAGLGWHAMLLDGLGSDQLAGLLGLTAPQVAEAEHPDCLLAVYPQGATLSSLALPEVALAEFGSLTWQGTPNRLGSRHVAWPIIDEVAAATEKPPATGMYTEATQIHQRQPASPPGSGLDLLEALNLTSLSLRQAIRQRRSAVAMDGRGSISREAFYKIMLKTLAGPGQYPFNTLPWRPLIHLVLFVHRVEGLDPGIYLLVRDPGQKEALRTAMRQDSAWERPPACPTELDLYRLEAGDARTVARQLSCQQEIASNGCFSLGMLTQFDGPLEHFGPWFYPRLFWECGAIGQVLYLEAEAAGVRGTGIGCFFDDAVHQLLGLETSQYQSLYHFTVGHPVEDTRLTTLAAYSPSQ